MIILNLDNRNNLWVVDEAMSVVKMFTIDEWSELSLDCIEEEESSLNISINKYQANYLDDTHTQEDYDYLYRLQNQYC